MKLKHKADHISIKQFEPVEIPDFTVFTGINGAGKTHLLDAIKKGNVEIENIDKSEIVYYNYNDFTVLTGNLQQNQTYQSKANEWNQNLSLNFQKINSIKQNFSQNKSLDDRILFSYLQNADFDFDSYFGQLKDYANLEQFKKESDFRKKMLTNRQNFTPTFFSLIEKYIQNELKLDGIEIEKLKGQFIKLNKEFEDFFKMNNEPLHCSLKSTIQKTGLSSINPSHFETPNFAVEEIINEEKTYQINKTNNTLNEVRSKKGNSNLNYYEDKEYIEKFGLSPVE
jgi:hypothetical protein